MSFGFSIGDFISVGSLALRLYASYREALSELKEAHHELLALHTALGELRYDLEDPDSTISRSTSRKTRNLSGLIARCKQPLQELDTILKSYNKLDETEKVSWAKAWQRARFGKENLDGIQHKLAVHLSGISLFLTSVSHEALSRLENRLETLTRLETKIDLLFAKSVEKAEFENNECSTAPVLYCPNLQGTAINGVTTVQKIICSLETDDSVTFEDIMENISFVNALVTTGRDRVSRAVHRRKYVDEHEYAHLELYTHTDWPTSPFEQYSPQDRKIPDGIALWKTGSRGIPDTATVPPPGSQPKFLRRETRSLQEWEIARIGARREFQGPR